MTHQQQPQQPATHAGEEYVEFRGGPMDGYRMPVTGWTEKMRATGVAHLCDHGTWGAGGRAWYSPPDGDPHATVWDWDGDSA